MKIPTLVLMLSLSFLMAIPATNITKVQAVIQSGPTAWSPFGPRSDTLLITVYADFNAMFSAFSAGQVDLTDWPVNPGDISSFGSNADFFLTNAEGELGIFELDRNAHKSFLGLATQQARTVPVAGIIATSNAAGCSTGFGQIVVNLKNGEAADATLIDTDNKVKATGPVAINPATDGGAGDGQYVLVGSGPGGCTLAGSYTISTSVYRGAATVSVGSAQVTTVSFRVNYNSDSTVKPTNAYIEIGRALAHLVDRPSYQSVPPIAGQADFLDIQAPPAQGLANLGGPSPASKVAQAVLNEDCAAHPWKSPCSPSSSYNLTPENIGGGSRWWGNNGANVAATAGYSGVDDIRAACDHFVAAGLTLVGGTCLDLANASAAGSQPGSYAHLNNNGQQLILYGRTDPRRRAFSAIFGDALNMMFNTPNGSGTCTVLYGSTCAPQYFTIGQVADIIFAGPPNLDDWSLYSAGWSLGSTPDHLWALYHSDFSGGVCSGVPEEFPNDYGFYCNPVYDGESAAGQFSTTLSDANVFFKRAAVTAVRDVMTMPMFTLSSQFVALNGWNHQAAGASSLVQQLGHGWQTSFWSLMNLQQVDGYTPSNSIYNPGGGVDGLIRRGFSQEVHKQSLFHATTVWDFEVLTQIYDSMLAANPRSGGVGLQLFDWMTTSHSATINAQGNTVQTWTLRNGLKFHDGVAVTAADVAYSILAYRDVPSANIQPSVATVISAVALNSRTLQVTLEAASAFYEANIGGVPILPKHVWAPICGDPPNPASPCGDPGFDPMAAGLMIGSGPWRCENITTGAIGGTCTQNADGSPGTQDVGIGGRIALVRNDAYMRGAPNVMDTTLQEISWADRDDNGVVNILDIADAALHFAQPDDYWDHPLFGVTDASVDIGEIATIAFHFDSGTTKPFAPSALTALDSQIDPYLIDSALIASPGPGAPYQVYFQGATVAGSNTVIEVRRTGTPTVLACIFAELNPNDCTPVSGTAEGSNHITWTFPSITGHYFILIVVNVSGPHGSSVRQYWLIEVIQ